MAGSWPAILLAPSARRTSSRRTTAPFCSPCPGSPCACAARTIDTTPTKPRGSARTPSVQVHEKTDHRVSARKAILAKLDSTKTMLNGPVAVTKHQLHSPIQKCSIQTIAIVQLFSGSKFSQSLFEMPLSTLPERLIKHSAAVTFDCLN